MTLKTRIKICGLLCFIPAIALFARLFYLQTFRHGELTTKAEKRIYTQTQRDTLRGRILDKNGIVLAESLRTYAVALSKKNVAKKEPIFAALADTLNISKEDLRTEWDARKNFFYVRKDVTPMEYEELEKRISKEHLTGLEIEPQYTRIYPFDGIAQDVIGATNSRNTGLSGIELMYNKTLSEETKSQRVKRARKGGIIYDKSQDFVPEIADIYLTLDALGQYYAESTIKEYATKYKVNSAFVIVQEPQTGNILAAASYPSKDGLSLPFQFTYEPGSTFKTIGAAAALDSGNVDMDSTFDMENNKWKLTGITIKDHVASKKPILTLSEVMEVSSNIGAGKVAYNMGAKTLYSYLKKFGFGIKTNVDFLGESGGILREYTRWQPIDTAKAGYGYTVSVTGAQLITAYSALANDGVLMQPHLIDRIKYANGEEEFLAEPVKVRRVVSSDTAKKVKTLLENVVSKGTGMPARIKGYTVAGKTGTTEKYAGGGKYATSSHIASFCGFVPAANPRFTILVVLDQPERALFGAASANIFAEIATKFLTLYSVQPDQENYES